MVSHFSKYTVNPPISTPPLARLLDGRLEMTQEEGAYWRVYGNHTSYQICNVGSHPLGHLVPLGITEVAIPSLKLKVLTYDTNVEFVSRAVPQHKRL